MMSLYIEETHKKADRHMNKDLTNTLKIKL